MSDILSPPPGGQSFVYQTKDGKLRIDMRFEGELKLDPVVKNFFITAMESKKHAIRNCTYMTLAIVKNDHLKKLFSDSELVEDSVIRNFRTTAVLTPAFRKFRITRSRHLTCVDHIPVLVPQPSLEVLP